MISAPRRFESLDDVRRALGAPRFLVFKHSFRCPVSSAAFGEYAAFHASHPQVPTAWIDVVEQRDLAAHVEAAVSVPHESPQALLVQEGRVAWHASHRDITRKALETALGMPSGLGGG